MALTYGFYNSIEGDRVYDAIQFGRIFDGIIKDGVYATYEKGMMVIASENSSEVIIQPGRAWFNHTWSYNDANIIMAAPNPEVLLERIDTLVLEVNEELSARENSYKWVQGTPSSRPVAPTLTNTSTIHQYPLCDVHRYPETTMIYTRDITNRIGTSDCPFATGVLEGIDLDAWINQWDDEFKTWENTTKSEYDTWENTTKAQFEAWMLAQESAFTIWYNAFKDQMAGDVQEVEDFVAYLESVLDASTAVHLQEEIDELKTEITSGSQITVTTINSELYNRNVTITEPAGTVLTEKFDGSGVAEFKSVPYVGNLVISSTYGQQTAERTVNTPYYARYSFAIAFWAATVNIVGDPEMAGYSVTVKDSEETIVSTVVLDENAQGVFTAIQPDTYKFTIIYGGETMEVTLSVTQETTYTVTLHAPGFDYEDWLEAGGVTGSYSSLDDVLADEVALRRLFTVHASVDYIADINDENEDIEKIINNDLAAKWINLRDYALDTLYANTVIKGYMDTADKYGYGEWALVGQVPKMISNSAPYGEASAQSANSGNEAYKAFDGDDSTKWTSSTITQSGGSRTEYIQYSFNEPVCVKQFHYVNGFLSLSIPSLIALSGSNDGTTFIPISEYTNVVYDSFYDVDNTESYKYYKLTITVTNNSAGQLRIPAVTTLQFYAYAPKGNVPIMTSNSAPYGVASANTEITPAWNAFDSDPNTYWQTNTTSGAYLAYKFTNPICAKRLYIANYAAAGRILTFAIQGSNDGSTWVDVDSNTHSYTNPTDGGREGAYLDFNNDSYYLHYRIAPITLVTSVYTTIGMLQFYGRELSVSVPKMYTNTTPYGEVSADKYYPTYGIPYFAFDGNDTSTGWSAYQQTNPTSGKIRYKFPHKVCIKEVVTIIAYDNGYRAKDYKVNGSDDNVTYQTIASGMFTNKSQASREFIDLSDNNTEYQYWELEIDSTYSGPVVINTLQFYGFDYSEKEFEQGSTKKWLYDHGVELETIYIAITGNSIVTKEEDAIYIKTVSGQMAVVSNDSAIDLTNYNLIRGKNAPMVTTYNTVSNTPIFLQCFAKPTKATSTSDYSTGYVASNIFDNTNMNTFGLDISSVNGNEYVQVGFYGSSTYSENKLKELWLE